MFFDFSVSFHAIAKHEGSFITRLRCKRNLQDFFTANLRLYVFRNVFKLPKMANFVKVKKKEKRRINRVFLLQKNMGLTVDYVIRNFILATNRSKTLCKFTYLLKNPLTLLICCFENKLLYLGFFILVFLKKILSFCCFE